MQVITKVRQIWGLGEVWKIREYTKSYEGNWLRLF